ncbi:MAG: hypothetical protein AB7T22_11040, partial [Calditrichaceae bacterium]
NKKTCLFLSDLRDRLVETGFHLYPAVNGGVYILIIFTKKSIADNYCMTAGLGIKIKLHLSGEFP